MTPNEDSENCGFNSQYFHSGSLMVTNRPHHTNTGYSTAKPGVGHVRVLGSVLSFSVALKTRL